jgi:ABC-2 type transport system permease protein
LTSIETARSLALTARLSLLDYLSVYSPAVLASTVVPRVVLQVLFFSLLGGYVAGDGGMTYAYVGATAHVVTLATVVKCPDVLLDEKAYGTLYRLRLSRVPLVAVLVARQWVYAVEALAAVTLSIVVAGAILGRWEVATGLLGLLPLYVVLIASTSALALATAVVSVGRRADTLLPNAMGLLLLLACGAIVPVASVGALAGVAPVLPLTHGLAAIRAALDGGAVGALLVREAVVGTGWYAVAVAGLRVQSWRARRSGHDDFL